MTKKKTIRKILIIPLLLLFICIISTSWSRVENSFEDNDVKLAEETVKSYALQCYALEGSYPETIDYLTENYTLSLNKDKYVYHYDYIGSNIMPDISVFAIK